MLRHIIIVAGAALLASGAGAQSQQGGSHNPATKDGSPHAVASPAKGANSFTESQARGRFTKAGYQKITKLWKKDGLWHANAVKDGRPHTVTLDYKGNISRR